MRHRLALMSLAAMTLAAPAAAQITGVATPDAVTILEAGKPALTYRITRPDPDKRWVPNSIHPIFAPDGTALTIDAPADHPFHRGAWWSWRRILQDGKVIADSWVMSDIAYEVKSATYHASEGGGGEIRTHVFWNQPSSATTLLEEHGVIRLSPLKGGVRVMEVTTDLLALKPGLAIAGSDDVKGYGGFSIRLPHHEALLFTSGGKPLVAKADGYPSGDIPFITAGEDLTITWPKDAGMPPWRVAITASADGKPVTDWIIRNSPSMQNAAWPNRTPANVPTDKPLRLRTTVTISPNP